MQVVFVWNKLNKIQVFARTQVAREDFVIREKQKNNDNFFNVS